jgi:hypothetical protein
MSGILDHINNDNEMKEFLELINLSNINFMKITEIRNFEIAIWNNKTTPTFILLIKKYIEDKFKDKNKEFLKALNLYTQFLDKHFLKIKMIYKKELDKNSKSHVDWDDSINLWDIYNVYQENTFINYNLEKYFINSEDKEEKYITLLNKYFSKLTKIKEQKKESKKNLDENKELENLLKGRPAIVNPIDIFNRIIERRKEKAENEFTVSFVTQYIIISEFELSESYLRSKRVKKYLSIIPDLKGKNQNKWQFIITKEHIKQMIKKGGTKELKN